MFENTKEDNEPSLENVVAKQITDLLENTSEVVTEYRCRYHYDSQAISICECCNADICYDCAYIRRNRSVCAKCMGSLDKALAGTGIASFFIRMLTHPFFVALVLTTFLGYIFISLGSIHRSGLLGEPYTNVLESERQYRLKMLLFTRKANRIETLADALQEMGRRSEAAKKFENTRVIYETLLRETGDRWEKNVLTLAKARILEKTGEGEYSEGLYRNLAGMPGPDYTYAAIAQFYLAKSRERTDPKEALKIYKDFLNSIRYVSDKFSQALKIMAHTEKTYSYESRIRRYTRTDFEYETAKAEALLRMGRLHISLGQPAQAKYRLELAVMEAGGTESGEQAELELKKLRSIHESEMLGEKPLSVEKEAEEKITITHFE